MSTRGINRRSSIRSKWTSALVATAAAIFMPLASASLLGDFDAREGSVDPSATQLSMVSSLGAKASWNKLGTPSSLIKYGDYLATDLQGPDATTVARNWVNANKALFRLSSVDSLQMMSDEAFPYSDAYAVTFRQEIGGLRTAEDGLLTVGIVGNSANGWKIAYVSATTTGDAALSGGVSMTAAEAYIHAAQNIGANVQISDISTSKADGEWTTFVVNGIESEQRARLRALATPSNGVRPVYETIYLKNANTSPVAYVHYIDAEDGTVWMRKDIVEQSHPTADAYSGTLGTGDGDCAIEGPWIVDAGESVGSIAASVVATLTTNDSTIDLLLDGAVVASQDTLFSPEVVAYSPAGGVPAGTYEVQICDYVDGAGWSALNSDYTGQIVFSEAGAPAAGLPYPPKWDVFAANPLYGDSTDNRDLWCWESLGDSNCILEIINTASRSPWDYGVNTDTPTFTTIGNNAQSAEAWVSPLTPGGTFHRPTSLDRNYSYPWTDQWRTTQCAPEFISGRSQDISAAVTNLFAMHNRMHDFSYELGFTERRWNAQEDNFGNNSPGTLDGDPVIGNAQAGAATGGAPSYLGRDNANMITLPDGVPPITNMYLWQPIAGAFYAPCADGDYDMAIIGHEYGHMIENRMIGKGDGRSGHHAGAMGESFGDFVGMEILNANSFVPVSGENPFSVGGFATGNGERAIRNYNMSYPRTGAFPEPGSSTTGSGLLDNVKVNPLNFSNMGYDFSGPQVHADGEIWSATNFTIRQYLSEKYEASYPVGDAVRQKECADGQRHPDDCPGNRRWMQIVFDAMLLMPTAPSMLEARDAYLAADMMRFGGANQAELWLAFAHRGFGENAASDNTIGDPIPDFESLLADNAVVTFEAVASDEGDMPISANIYVGHFEARVTPIADTDGNTSGSINLDEFAGFAPGEYEFVAQARGFGHVRFTQTFAAGETKTVTIKMPTNHASSAKGAAPLFGMSDGVNPEDLIDDTEATNWDKEADGVAINEPILGRPQVTIDLGGTMPVTINRAQVSAMLFSQNRFTALREFKLQTSTNGISFSDWIVSTADAFPGHTPRPVSPETILRSFDGDPVDATHVRIIAMNNQCTGNSAFQGEQDADPLNVTDCTDTSITGETLPIFGDPSQVLAPRHDEVHIAELQVFGSEGGVDDDNNGGNNAPVANDDGPVTVNAGGSVSIDVLINDSDVETSNNDLTVTLVSGPTLGSASFNSMTRKFDYNNDNDDGTSTSDSFVYRITDAGEKFDDATVTITINRDGGTGDNECADDTDSDYKDCRVKGSGKLNDGDDMDDDSDSDKFTIETKQKGSNPDGSPHVDGKLYFDTDGPMRKVRGTPNAQSINGSSATVWGTCEYESDTVAKQNCTFEVNVTETDQFGIKIYDDMDLLYEYNKQTIIYGGIDVRSDEEYE